MSGDAPSCCPSCGSGLRVVKLQCPSCSLEVAGDFGFCPVCRLDDRVRELFGIFLEARGNVRRIQEVLGISYPTARQRVEEMFQALQANDYTGDAVEVLRRVREGRITVDEAERLLRGVN